MTTQDIHALNSTREKVLELDIKGHTGPEIAELLYISIGRVYKILRRNNNNISTCKKAKDVSKHFHRKQCPFCNKFFLVPPNRKYCTSTCSTLANNSRDRYIIFERDGFQCIYCGRTTYQDGIKLHVDHIHPKKSGGKDIAGNLVSACSQCNLGKSWGIIPPDIEKYILKEVMQRNQLVNVPNELEIKL